MPLHLAILTGGPSSESDVARRSAASVRTAIGERAQVTVFDFPRDIDDFLRRRRDFDCALPVFHGRGGEDGTMQGFLETLRIPYIFSGIEAHALAIDKVRTGILVRQAGVHVPASSVVLTPSRANFMKPVVMKPVDGGSSIGVTIAHNRAEFDAGLDRAGRMSSKVMIEDYIRGREFSVAVIDVDDQTIALPVISIVSKHEFFDYESKYQDGGAEERCPADIPDDLAQCLQSAAVTVHQAIGARHVTRSDFIVDADGTIWFLEINTIPGMSVLLPKAITASGRDFGEVLMSWVDDAIRMQGQTRIPDPAGEGSQKE